MKKGLIYGFEAIFGGLIVMLYLAFLIHNLPSYSDYTEKYAFYRENIFLIGRYLSNSLEFRKSLELGEESTLNFISYFLNPISNYDVYIYGKGKHRPLVGIYTYPSRIINTNYTTDWEEGDVCRNKIKPFVITLKNIECKEGYSKMTHRHYLLVKERSSFKKIYSLLYDVNGDGVYEINQKEGPFIRGDIIKQEGKYYYVNDLSDMNNVPFLVLLDNSDLDFLDYLNRVYSQSIDTISFSPRIVFFSNNMDIMGYDALFINKSIDDSSFGNKIEKYFLKGGNVILTPNSNLFSLLRGLGFINAKDYYKIVSDDSSFIEKFNKKEGESLENAQIERYYNQISEHYELYNMSSYCKYTTLKPYDAIKIASINLSNTYYVAVKKYNSKYFVYVDHDGDCNFDESPDNSSLREGDVFLIDNVKYRIKKIIWDKYLVLTPYGDNITIRNAIPKHTYIFKSKSSYKFYSLIVLSNVYLALNTSYDIGDAIDIPLVKVDSNVWKGTLRLNENHTYVIYVDNSSGKDEIYFENNPDIRYKLGDIVAIDSEIFLMLRTMDGSKLRFTLMHRANLPILTLIRNENNGDLIYYAGNFTSLPERDLFIASLYLELNNNPIEIYLSAEKGDNTGIVFIPVKIGDNLNETIFLGVRRYL